MSTPPKHRWREKYAIDACLLVARSHYVNNALMFLCREQSRTWYVTSGLGDKWPANGRQIGRHRPNNERISRLFVSGAEEGIRTPTVLLPPAPQAGASASSATSARANEIGSNFKLLTSAFYLFPVGPDGAGVAGGVAGVVDPLGAVVPDAAGAPGAGADCAGAGAGAGPRVPLMIEPDVPR